MAPLLLFSHHFNDRMRKVSLSLFQMRKLEFIRQHDLSPACSTSVAAGRLWEDGLVEGKAFQTFGTCTKARGRTKTAHLGNRRKQSGTKDHNCAPRTDYLGGNKTYGAMLPSTALGTRSVTSFLTYQHPRCKVLPHVALSKNNNHNKLKPTFRRAAGYSRDD